MSWQMSAGPLDWSRPRGRAAAVRSATLLNACSIACLALLLCGCSHSLVYDESRDKQAQQAQQAVTQAHVSDAVNAMEKAFADVAAREESSAREYETYLFDLELKTVSRAASLSARFDPEQDEGIDGLATVLRDRLAKLGVLAPGETELSDGTIAALWRTDSDIAEARDAAQATFTVFFGTTGHDFANCAQVHAAAASGPESPPQAFLARLGSDIQRRAARVKFADLVEHCKQIDAAVTAHESLYSGGLIAQLSTHVASLGRDINAYAEEAGRARQQVAAATHAFEAANPKPEESSLERLQAAAEALDGKLEDLLKPGRPAISQVIAQERLVRLQTVLHAIAGTPADSPVPLNSETQTATAVAIVRALPLLKNEADKLFANATNPRLVPLLAALDHQKLVVQGFQTRRQAKQKQLDAAQKRLDCARREALAAAEVMRPILDHPHWEDRSLKDLDASLTGPDKTALYRALGTYANDVQQARIDGAIWEAREQAARFEENLAYSKVAASQWDGLMDLLAKVLADYHAAGIKKSDIAEFFKAVGLVSIGVGVAQ